MAEDIDLTEAKINIAKFRADGEKYFSLFDKHIPTGLGSDCEVLLYKIGNMAVIKGIVDKNPTAKYAVYDRECICRLTKIACPGVDATGYASDVKSRDPYDIFEDKDMKFDLIIMNPPYNKNLHLKILAEAIRHLKDEKSLCVNLSPVRWLQDPLARYKKTSDLKRFEDNVAKHIEYLEICDSAKLTNLFIACMTFGIGVYICVKNRGHYDYMQYADAILDKIIPNVKGFPVTYYKDHKHGIFVPITFIDGGHKERNNNASASIMSICRNPIHYGDYFINGISTNGKTLEQCKADNKRCTNGNVDAWPIIVFNSEIEVKNFVQSTKTIFFKYIYKKSMVDIHVHSQFLPFMDDAVNPRTGLKGYLGEWTDEDLYAYFNITEDEKKLIEQTMEKYR